MTRRILAAPAAAMLLLLAACVPTETSPEEPGEVPAEEQATTPHPVLDLDCADLVTADDLAAFLAEEAAPAPYREAVLSVVGGIPEDYPLAQLGATDCYWRTDTADYSFGGPDGYPDLRVIVRPDAAAARDAFVARYYPEATPDPVLCLDYVRSCTYEGLVGDDWLTLSIEGVAADKVATAPAAAAELVERLRAAVERADRVDPWTPPSGTLEVPACDTIATTEELVAATGVTVAPSALVPSTDPGRSDVDGIDPLVRCGLMSDLDGFGPDRVVLIRGLTGGAWAWADASGLRLAGGERETVEIEGLADGDEAWLACDDELQLCRIALVLGGSWIEIDVDREPGFQLPSAFEQDAREATLAVAALVVGNLA